MSLTVGTGGGVEVVREPIQTRPTAPDTGMISGRVADPQGVAIATARVTIFQDKTGWSYATASDCGGFYRLSNLLPGSYHVRIESPGFKPENGAAVEVRPSQVTQFEHKMRLAVLVGGPEVTVEDHGPPTGAIQGAVTDSSGNSLPARITVTAKTTGKTYDTTTDSQGTYRLVHLPAGRYELRVEADKEKYGAGPRLEADVSPPGVTCADIHVPVGKEIVEVCSASCMIEGAVMASSPHPGLALEVYTPSNIVFVGSEVSLTVTLTNMTNHPIFVHAGEQPGSVFAYQLYAFGHCNCPGHMDWRSPAVDRGSDPIHRVPPGGTLTERVSLNTGRDLLWPDTYSILVQRPDTSGEVNCCDEPKGVPLVVSNSIKVTVMPR